MKVPLSNFDLDMLMALRFAYYVHSFSVLPDHVYDAMEAEYKLLHGALPVGSERKEDYSPAQRALALYFMLSGRVVARAPGASKGEDLL